jgi:hypothetical protein
LPQLLTQDPTEPAIEVRVKVRGAERLSFLYFDAIWTAVAYKRLVDNVLVAIDRKMLYDKKVGLESVYSMAWIRALQMASEWGRRYRSTPHRAAGRP